MKPNRFFENIIKINKLLPKLTKGKKKEDKILGIKREYHYSLNRYVRLEYYKQLFAKKMDNLDEMDKFQRQKLPKWPKRKQKIWITLYLYYFKN